MTKRKPPSGFWRTMKWNSQFMDYDQVGREKKCGGMSQGLLTKASLPRVGEEIPKLPVDRLISHPSVWWKVLILAVFIPCFLKFGDLSSFKHAIFHTFPWKIWIKIDQSIPWTVMMNASEQLEGHFPFVVEPRFFRLTPLHPGKFFVEIPRNRNCNWWARRSGTPAPVLPLTCHWMGFNGIEWDWMGLNGIEWDWMGLNGIEWDWMGLNGI